VSKRDDLIDAVLDALDEDGRRDRRHLVTQALARFSVIVPGDGALNWTVPVQTGDPELDQLAAIVVLFEKHITSDCRVWFVDYLEDRYGAPPDGA
jgi:hypothetical protein